MRISLNLATRPFADIGPALKLLRIGIGVLAVLAIGLGWGVHAFHQKAVEARAREHAIDQRIAAIQKEHQGFEEFMRKPENVQLLTQAAALNKLFDEKSFSWTLAIEDLETVLPAGVQVSSLEPARTKDGHITLHLRVIGPRDRSVELVSNLEHSKRFLLPRIAGESAETTGGPGEKLEPVSASNRVNFDIFAEYNPMAPNEPRAKKSVEQREAESAATNQPQAVPQPQNVPAPHAAPPVGRPGSFGPGQGAGFHQRVDPTRMDPRRNPRLGPGFGPGNANKPNPGGQQ